MLPVWEIRFRYDTGDAGQTDLERGLLLRAGPEFGLVFQKGQLVFRAKQRTPEQRPADRVPGFGRIVYPTGEGGRPVHARKGRLTGKAVQRNYGRELGAQRLSRL